MLFYEKLDLQTILKVSIKFYFLMNLKNSLQYTVNRASL